MHSGGGRCGSRKKAARRRYYSGGGRWGYSGEGAPRRVLEAEAVATVRKRRYKEVTADVFCTCGQRKNAPPKRGVLIILT